jgi:hypothetical protein
MNAELEAEVRIREHINSLEVEFDGKETGFE